MATHVGMPEPYCNASKHGNTLQHKPTRTERSPPKVVIMADRKALRTSSLKLEKRQGSLAIEGEGGEVEGHALLSWK